MNRSNSAKCLALAIVISLLVTFSRLAEFPNGDSILFSIISLQNPTTYYWAQNRLGSLLPILFSPIHNIEVNFYLQVFCRTLAAAMTPIFLIMILRPRVPPLLSFAGCLVFVFLFIRHEPLISFWLDGSPYALSLILAAAGVHFFFRRRPNTYSAAAGAMIFVILASWVNIAIVLVTAPIFCLLSLLLRSKSFAVLFVLAILGFSIESWHAKGYGPASYEGFVQLTWEPVAGLFSAIDRSLNLAWFFFIAAGTLLATVLKSGSSRSDRLRLLGLLGGCAASILFIAATNWFQTNRFHPRYLSLPIVLIVGSVGMLFVQLLYQVLLQKVPQAAMLSGAAAAAVGACMWSVEPKLPHRLINPATNVIAELAIRSNIHLIVGDYWRTWPAVFETIRRRGADDTYGLAPRGNMVLAEIINAFARDPRLICVDPEPESCRRSIEFFIGSPTYQGKPVSEAMRPIESSREPFYILYELKSP